MIAPEVITSSDPSPLELIFARKFRAALENSAYSSEARKCEGKFGIRSAKDPQAVTIQMHPKRITLNTGISPDCQLVLTIDLDRPQTKPAIKGLLRYPLLALKVAKALEFPSITWSDALKRFWDQHQDKPGMPTGLTVKCLDEDRQLSVGNTDDACYFEGKAADLADAFSGEAPFGQQLVADKVRGRYRFEHLVVLTGITIDMMLGQS